LEKKPGIKTIAFVVLDPRFLLDSKPPFNKKDQRNRGSRRNFPDPVYW